MMIDRPSPPHSPSAFIQSNRRDIIQVTVTCICCDEMRMNKWNLFVAGRVKPADQSICPVNIGTIHLIDAET